jgi:hypothetical protein
MGEKNTSMGGFWVFLFIFIWSGRSGIHPTKIIKSVNHPKPKKKRIPDQNHKIRKPPETRKK